jgi:PAS domain S-box-containing protein
MSDRGLVVIIDHDEDRVGALRELLAGDGYDILAVGPGTALELVAEAEPDLVLVEAQLPDDDSFELRAHLKETEQTADVPVIFLTSLDDDEARLAALDSGDELIVRPLEPSELLARVERQVTVSKVRTALRRSEAEFRSVMESAIDAIISVDAEGRIRSWNSAASALFGFAESDILGELIEIIIPDRFRESHQIGIHRVSSGGPTHVIGSTVELAAIRSDGSEFPVELSLATWFLDDQRYYTGIIRDITERKQAEEKFRSVTEAASDAIISADHLGNIITWNQAATRILGYSEEEAVGQRLELIIPDRFQDAHRVGMARFTETGEAHVIGSTVELAARRKSGEELPIELSLSTWTVRDERYYTGIVRDIAERKEAEEALRRSEQDLRERTEELKTKNEALVETLARLDQMNSQLILQEKMASLGRLSAGMAHELNNPAAAAQRGIAHLAETLAAFHEVQLGIAESGLQREQLDHMAELEALTQERARKPAELNVLARSDREAAIEAWLDANGVAATAESVAALVSIGYEEPDLDALAETFTGSQLPLVIEWIWVKYDIHSLIAEIGLGTGRIVELVAALKTYTYMDQAPVQEVDVSEGLDNTLIILHNKLKAGVTVVREYAEDLPTIEAFASELNQVWTNLIDNAVDAMNGAGRLTVRARRADGWVVVEIEDDGPGIAEEHQSVIFDPFFTTKGPGSGSGLGLNISRNIITQKHDGEISVESVPGRTCFTVRLPIAAQSTE